jgi:hypothetical protein
MGTAAQIAAQLRNLVTNRTLTEAMTRSVLIVEGNTKREAPVKTGNLRRTITSRVEQGGKRGVIGTNAPYARPVHDGSRPHIITAKRAKALYWKGASHPVRSVKHPGNKPKRALRAGASKRAADTSRGPVEREPEPWSGVGLVAQGSGMGRFGVEVSYTLCIAQLKTTLGRRHGHQEGGQRLSHQPASMAADLHARRSW